MTDYYETFENRQAEEDCIMETEKNRYTISRKDTIKLRGILDKLKVNYILDDVSFHSIEGSAALAKANELSPQQAAGYHVGSAQQIR